MRFKILVLTVFLVGCAKPTQPIDWLIADEAGDAPLGADIMEASVVHSTPREVRVHLTDPLADGIQIQVILAGEAGLYSLSAEGTEMRAAYTCHACSPAEVQQAGTGTQNGPHLSWTVDAPDLTGQWYARSVDIAGACTADRAGSEADNGIPPC